MTNSRPLFWLFLAIGLWGLMHAVGARQAAPHAWRGAGVIAATAVFLAFWGGALALRARRVKRLAGRGGSVDAAQANRR